MRKLLSLSLLAFLLPVGSHAQQRIDALIKNIQENRTDVNIKTIIKRNEQTLKLEYEQKWMQLTDKELADQFKQAFKNESERAVYFEQNEKKDAETYTLQFNPQNAMAYHYYLKIDPQSSHFTLNVEKRPAQ